MDFKPSLRNKFERFASLSKEEWAILESKIHTKVVKAGEYLLKPGEICTFVGSVKSGIFRLFWINEAGKERSLHFFFPHDSISNYSSFLTQIPSKAYIQCLEDGEILYFTYEDNQMLINQFPSYAKINRLFTEQLIILLINRIHNYSFLSAEDRYKKLLAEQPNIFQLLPLSYISEFLNIEPQSLSRVRKKLAKNIN